MVLCALPMSPGPLHSVLIYDNTILKGSSILLLYYYILMKIIITTIC